jgi:photosystem II stability/assembly factor-like uncharacterized protein
MFTRIPFALAPRPDRSPSRVRSAAGRMGVDRGAAHRARALAFAVLALLAGHRPAAPQAPDQPLLRMQYLREQRAYPFARVPAGALERARSQLVARWPAVLLQRRGLRGPFEGAASAAAGERVWAPLGPAPIATAATGRISTIAVHPTNPAILYVGGAQGGVWKSSDGGATWAPTSDGECSLAMGSIAIDPVTPDILYAGTGELHFSGDSYYGCGVLRSTDGGSTWTQLGASIFDTNVGGARVSRILVDPVSAGSAVSTTVYAATSVGVYRSTDSGLNWTRVLEGIATDLVRDPLTPATLYAAIGSPAGDARNGIYRSTDGGRTWNRLGGGFPTGDVGRIALAIAPSAPATLYAAIQTSFGAATGSGQLFGIYRTTDAGNAWSRAAATGADCGTQCWYDLVIEVDPLDATAVWFGGVLLFRSTDGAASFRNVLGNVHVDQHALTFDPGNPGTLYVGNDGGIYRTTTAGATWQSLNTNLALTQFYAGISPHPFDPFFALGGTQDNGTLEFAGVPTWENVLGGDGGFTAIDYGNPAIAYAETQWSVNSGFSGPRRRIAPGPFVRLVAGINAADRALFIPPLVIDPANPAVLYFGTFRVYRTANRAESWTAISPDLTGGVGRVSAIAPAPSDPATLYVGTSDGNLQVTRDLGTSWSLRENGLPDRYVTDIAVDRLQPGSAVLSVSGFGTGHVFRTTDFGNAWTDISTSLPDVPVNAVIEIGAEIFVGTDLGVFVTQDLGATWTPFVNGLPNVAVFDLAYANETGIAIAGTHGRGMFSFRPLAAASLVLSADTVRLTALLDSVRLAATVLDTLGAAVAKPFISWRSLDAAVATVDAAGLVRARGNGTAGIIATMAGVADTARIIVQQVAVSLAGLPDTASLVVGERRTFVVTATDANGQPVVATSPSWTSSNPAVATVDPAGRVTAVATGNTVLHVQLASLTDSARLRIGPPSIAVLEATAIAPAARPSSAAGVRLPLLRLRWSINGFEAVEITRLGFDATGDDPGASLLLVRDFDDDGVIDPADPVVSTFPVSLRPGTPSGVTLSTNGFAIPGEGAASLIVALALSGQSPNGAGFQARFLPGSTATVGLQSGLQNRLEQPAGPVASALVSTTLLDAGERLSFSENPVRSARLILNFASRPRTAAIYTVTGRLVLDLGAAITEDGRVEWNLRNSDGTPVAPGVYLVVFDIEGARFQEKLFVLRRSDEPLAPQPR